MPDILYSVIIPMYNAEKTIERTLESIINQKGNWKDKIEIIIVNDRSTDQSAEIAQEFLSENAAGYNFTIVCTTNELEQGPGNARQFGLDIAKGKWITFIDSDDIYTKDAFNIVEEFINQEENKDAKVIVSNFMNWDMNNNDCLIEFDHDSTWVHGKWYLKEFLDVNNIRFRENLFTHEDIYFNTTILSCLIGQNKDYHYLLKPTYKWIIKEGSITRQIYDGKHTYVEKYLRDYIFSIVEPSLMALQNYPEKAEFYRQQIITTLLYSYFYYQSFCYSLGEENVIKDNILYIKEIVFTLKNVFNMTPENIIDYVYQNIGYYEDVKQKSKIGALPFIEMTSFRDFILKI